MAIVGVYFSIYKSYTFSRIRTEDRSPLVATINTEAITVVDDDVTLTDIFFSGNPIKFSYTGDAGNAGDVIQLELKVERSYDFNDFPVVYTTKKIADSNGNVDFYLNTILDSILRLDYKKDVPGQNQSNDAIYNPLTSGAYLTKHLFRRFKYVIKNLTDNTTVTTSGNYRVIRGKQTDIDFKINNFFNNIGTNKLLATHKPRRYNYKIGNWECIPIITYSSQSSLYLITIGTSKIGVRDIISAQAVTTGGKGMPVNYFMKVTDVNMVRLEVFYSYNRYGTQVASEKFIFDVVEEKDYPVYQYLFRNQYGCMDIFTTTGRRIDNVNTEKQLVNAYRNDVYSVYEHALKTAYVSKELGYTQNSGFLPFNQRAHFQGFLASDEVYELMTLNKPQEGITMGNLSSENTYLVPVNIQTKGVEHRADREELQETNTEFKVTYSFL